MIFRLGLSIFLLFGCLFLSKLNAQELSDDQIFISPGIVSLDSLPISVQATYRKLKLAAEKKRTDILNNLATNSEEFNSVADSLSKSERELYIHQLIEEGLFAQLPIILTDSAYYYVDRYIWPYWINTPLNELTNEEKKIICKIVGEDQYSSMMQDNRFYLGPRLAIKDNGEWIFYGVGD